jgi:hypothetical protein
MFLCKYQTLGVIFINTVERWNKNCLIFYYGYKNKFKQGDVMRIYWIVSMIIFSLSSWQTTADAAMVFNLKFGTDATYKNAKILKPGEASTVTVYVSNIPSPGLGNMGFSLEYDPALLQIAPDTTEINQLVWGLNSIDQSDLAGGRIVVTGVTFAPGLKENVPLATFSFTRLAEGHAPLTLRKPWAVDLDGQGTEQIIDGFCFHTDDPDNVICLDDEIGDGIILGSVADAGDYSGDGDVDGEDLSKLIIEACPAGSCGEPAPISEFAGKYGTSGP